MMKSSLGRSTSLFVLDYSLASIPIPGVITRMACYHWRRVLLAAWSCWVVLGLAGARSGVACAAEPLQRDVFVSGREGYHTFRIPALLAAKDGSLLAFCEGRKTSASDAGDVDLLLKRSTDAGKTWGPLQVLWDDGPNTCGNPCPVLDETTGVIWLLMTHNPGQTTERQINQNQGGGTRTVWVAHSTDDGKTWTAPRDITPSVKPASWTWYATGPGVGLQLQHGLRKGWLVIPCDHSSLGATDLPGRPIGGSHVIYSDDDGQSWRPGAAVEPAMNECQVVELADGNGSLLLNMRNGAKGHQRSQSTSHDGGQTWSRPEAQSQLVEPRCQASFMRYNWPAGNQPGRLLFCNPAGLERTNLTLRISYDDGKSWPVARTLHPGPSAYSCLAVMPDKTVGCLYECGETHPYERLRFLCFPLAWAENKN